MKVKVPKKVKFVSPEQHVLADLLLSISPLRGAFQKHYDKQYITLDVRVNASKRNKNAVSVLANRVSFMVPDWTFEQRAKTQGFSSSRCENKRVGKRLVFHRLTVKAVEENHDFFSELLLVSIRESQSRQGQPRFGWTGDQIENIEITLYGHKVEGEWLTRFSQCEDLSRESFEDVLRAFRYQHKNEGTGLTADNNKDQQKQMARTV